MSTGVLVLDVGVVDGATDYLHRLALVLLEQLAGVSLECVPDALVIGPVLGESVGVGKG